jgi:hypothetical protein
MELGVEIFQPFFGEKVGRIIILGSMKIIDGHFDHSKNSDSNKRNLLGLKSLDRKQCSGLSLKEGRRLVHYMWSTWDEGFSNTTPKSGCKPR